MSMNFHSEHYFVIGSEERDYFALNFTVFQTLTILTVHLLQTLDVSVWAWTRVHNHVDG